jgi:hypothetical protein
MAYLNHERYFPHICTLKTEEDFLGIGNEDPCTDFSLTICLDARNITVDSVALYANTVAHLKKSLVYVSYSQEFPIYKYIEERSHQPDARILRPYVSKASRTGINHSLTAVHIIITCKFHQRYVKLSTPQGITRYSKGIDWNGHTFHHLVWRLTPINPNVVQIT